MNQKTSPQDKANLNKHVIQRYQYSAHTKNLTFQVLKIRGYITKRFVSHVHFLLGVESVKRRLDLMVKYFPYQMIQQFCLQATHLQLTNSHRTFLKFFQYFLGKPKNLDYLDASFETTHTEKACITDFEISKSVWEGI